MRQLPDLSLYLVLDPGLCAPFGMVETARAAVAGGVGVVQLRHKTASTRERIEICRALQEVLSGSGAALVINDDVEAAIALAADGLHVGQGDAPVSEARRAIGSDMLLGLSVECDAHVSAVDPTVVDYVGVSPVFATGTKPDHAPPVGLDGLAKMVARCPVPCVGIGGIGPANAAAVIRAGAAGVAVVSAICGRPDPEAAARDLARRIEGARA